ncbi:hypothetical protein [Agarilytica rhodophyticola]|uniref:hypothetical protein n=1 Tax=Agarilytica rhodophyticola TaxID=1737490 RepID=UPI0013153729|nr:hypothetical protein [Agarilytica rhodophyticola]
MSGIIELNKKDLQGLEKSYPGFKKEDAGKILRQALAKMRNSEVKRRPLNSKKKD